VEGVMFLYPNKEEIPTQEEKKAVL